jgi:Cu2+-exporting ATPase
LLALFEFEEELKADAREEVSALQGEGYAIHVLSGDLVSRAGKIGAELGLPLARIHGAMQPEDKARLLRELDRRDTWMIGDGINDGPAFDAAYCAATPAIDRPSLPARADLYFLGDGIAAVRATLHAARKLERVLRANLAIAVTYNLCAVTACLFGLVGPLAAAILMPASSLGLLLFTSARLSWRRTAWTS